MCQCDLAVSSGADAVAVPPFPRMDTYGGEPVAARCVQLEQSAPDLEEVKHHNP